MEVPTPLHVDWFEVVRRPEITTPRRLYGGPADGEVITPEHLDPNRAFRWGKTEYLSDRTKYSLYRPEHFYACWRVDDGMKAIVVARFIASGHGVSEVEMTTWWELVLGACAAVLFTYHSLR